METLQQLDHIRDWDPDVRVVEFAPSRWSAHAIEPGWPDLEILRISASRPWRLSASTPTLRTHLRYPGRVRQILVESIVNREHSQACLAYARASGEFDAVVIVDPQHGQGFAHDVAIRRALTAPYVLKWDDDFDALVDLPVADCIALMRDHASIHQIAFNKRRTVPRKPFWSDEWPAWQAARARGLDPNEITAPRETHGKPVTFVKQERRLVAATFAGREPVARREFWLTVKDKWWFGPAVWDMAFLRRHWRFFAEHHHNRFNDLVLYKLIDPTAPDASWPGSVPAERVEAAIGCYLWGRIGDERMVAHTGKGDSHWTGEYAKRMVAEGRAVEGATDDQGRTR